MAYRKQFENHKLRNDKIGIANRVMCCFQGESRWWNFSLFKFKNVNIGFQCLDKQWHGTFSIECVFFYNWMGKLLKREPHICVCIYSIGGILGFGQIEYPLSGRVETYLFFFFFWCSIILIEWRRGISAESIKIRHVYCSSKRGPLW